MIECLIAFFIYIIVALVFIGIISRKSILADFTFDINVTFSDWNSLLFW